MEGFNGTFRDHEVTFRDLKKTDTPIIDGFMVYYNYTKNTLGLLDGYQLKIQTLMID